jgi:hypothetical protein
MTKPKEPTEDELDRTYKLGQSTGLSEAAGFLLEEASKNFKRRRDSEAELLRGYALDLEKRAEERHPGVPKS